MADEPLEKIHLWLAERFPTLRERCSSGHSLDEPDSFGAFRMPKEKVFCWEGTCDGRVWYPNVTTDSLMEALTADGNEGGRYSLERSYRSFPHNSWIVTLESPKLKLYTSNGPTFHEALCRAFFAALEATG